MISGKWARIIIATILVSLLVPYGVGAAKKVHTHNVKVSVKVPKMVSTLAISRKWFRPRANSTKYQRVSISGKDKYYKGVIAEKGVQYYFKRFAFLADGRSKKSKFKIPFVTKKTEPQGVAISGHYMYVQMSIRKSGGNNHRYGRIIRYNLKTLNKAVNKNGKHNQIVKVLHKSRKYVYSLGTKKSTIRKRISLAKKKLNRKDQKIYSAVTIGPKYYTGHGQSFAYNPKDHQLYNAAYSLKSDSGRKSHPFLIQKISKKSLKPVKKWKLNIYRKIKSKKGKSKKQYLQMHTLTFDKAGRFYFSQTYGKQAQVIANRFRGMKKGYLPNRHQSDRKHNLGNRMRIYRGNLGKNQR